MKILTWNIQATKGCDGQYDLPRITTLIKQYPQLDVICLQEVSRHISDLNADDQLTLIAQQFPDYVSAWGPGFSVPGELEQRYEFGNLTLVRKPVYRSMRMHTLPSPPVDDLQIPRTMVETTVIHGDEQLSIFNAHLAFHSSQERIEQIQALTHLRDQILEKARLGKQRFGWGPYQYTDTSHSVVLCGDLNVDSESEEFKAHITDQHWLDCWTVQQDITKSPSNRQPTCGCFDSSQWPEGPHVRDYFLATRDLKNCITRVSVDVETAASDHQPVLLELTT